jgi:hypothetical protein
MLQAQDHVADWHGIQAIRQYHKGNMKEFRRHAHIADERWAKCGARVNEALSRLQQSHARTEAPRGKRGQQIIVLVNGRPLRSRR